MSESAKTNLALIIAVVAAALALPSAVDTGYRFFSAETPAVASSREDAAMTYAQMTSTFDPRLSAGAEAYAAPGSSADLYAKSWRQVVAAWHSANSSVNSTATVVPIDNGLRVCWDERRCIELTDFTYDEQNRVQNYSMGSIPVGALIIPVVEETLNEQKGFPTTIAGAYTNAEGTQMRLALHVQNTTGKSLSIDYGSVIYRDGKDERQKATASGPAKLSQAQRGQIYVTVAGTPGGWLGLYVKKEDSKQLLWFPIG